MPHFRIMSIFKAHLEGHEGIKKNFVSDMPGSTPSEKKFYKNLIIYGARNA